MRKTDETAADHHQDQARHPACFWHGHGLSPVEAAGTDFWRKKIDGNVARDRKAIMALIESGWRVLVIWECALRGPARQTEEAVMGVAVQFIREDECACCELMGSSNRDAGSPAPGKGCVAIYDKDRWAFERQKAQ